ncbi:MAG: hypothetical protein MJ093_02985 [Saccharofermentans sp.]|nr:hypothetical protein [Saccharofermentans sp.]
MADTDFVNRVLEFCYYTQNHRIHKSTNTNYVLYTQVINAIKKALGDNIYKNNSDDYNYYYSRETITARIAGNAIDSTNGNINYNAKLFDKLGKFINEFSDALDKRKFLKDSVKSCDTTESSLIALLLWSNPKYSLSEKHYLLDYLMYGGKRVCESEEKTNEPEDGSCEAEKEEYCYDTWLEDNISECTDWRFFYRSLAIISKDKAGDVKIADMINTYLVHINSDKKIEDDWSVESLFRLFNTEGQSIRERYRIASYLKTLFDIDFNLPSRWSYIPTFPFPKCVDTEKSFYYFDVNEANKYCCDVFKQKYERDILLEIMNSTFTFDEYCDGYESTWESHIENISISEDEELEVVLVPKETLIDVITTDNKYKLDDNGLDALLIYDYIKYNDGEVGNHVHGSKLVKVSW